METPKGLPPSFPLGGSPPRGETGTAESESLSLQGGGEKQRGKAPQESQRQSGVGGPFTPPQMFAAPPLRFEGDARKAHVPELEDGHPSEAGGEWRPGVRVAGPWSLSGPCPEAANPSLGRVRDP